MSEINHKDKVDGQEEKQHIRELTQQPYASTLMKKKRLRCFVHVSWMNKDRLPKRICEWDPVPVGGDESKEGSDNSGKTLKAGT